MIKPINNKTDLDILTELGLISELKEQSKHFKSIWELSRYPESIAKDFAAKNSLEILSGFSKGITFWKINHPLYGEFEFKVLQRGTCLLDWTKKAA